MRLPILIIYHYLEAQYPTWDSAFFVALVGVYQGYEKPHCTKILSGDFTKIRELTNGKEIGNFKKSFHYKIKSLIKCRKRHTVYSHVSFIFRYRELIEFIKGM